MMWRRGALGLRGRIVGAVIVTTVATLAVAALALLGPLETKLRAAEFKTFERQVGRATAGPFRHLGDLSTALESKVSSNTAAARALQRAGAEERHRIVQAENALATPLGASAVALLGLPNASGSQATLIAHWPVDADTADAEPFDDATRAFARNGQIVYSTHTSEGSEYARAAVPFTTSTPGAGPAAPPARWVLVVRKPFAEVNDAVHAVRTAFLDAALAGLALTLVLAIPLSSRIVRRLRQLRQAALQLAGGGPPVVIPGARARDEVGDLARTFALMQEQLRQQEEARRAFVATASHELRTPLTSLEGMLELLDEDLAETPPDLQDARALLARVRAQSHRLARLAADLLDLSRIDAQVQLRSEPIELSELSRAVLAEFELGRSERGVHSELHDPGDQVWALGDPGSVARVLRILLDNAMRVSPPGSEIIVELSGGERAVLSVCDQGPGVPVDERSLIFERFQRGRNTSGQAGFGLGLAIGRELAERMGGELVLEERDVPGAKFTLRLPVAAAPEPDPLAML